MATSTKFTLKCAFCKQDFDRLNVLVCNHKLCDQCYQPRKKLDKVVQCPIKGCSTISDAKVVKVNEYKSFTDSLVSMQEQSVLCSVQEYHNVLDEQEVHVEMQIHNIEKQIEETSETIDKDSINLNELYERRLKELKDHFKTLKDDLILIGVKRKEQLCCILGLVKDLKDLLQKQRKWFEDILRKSAESMDLRKLQVDIEAKMSGIEIMDIEIPAMDITIVPNENMVKDSFTVTAPDPTYNIHKLRMRNSIDLNLLELSDKSLFKGKLIDLPEMPKSVCSVNDSVYCACPSEGIVTISAELTERRCITTVEMGHVHGLATLQDSTLIIGTMNGLYHISGEGEQIQRLATGMFEQVRSRGTTVCAMSGSSDTMPNVITIYTYIDRRLTKTKSFSLPFNTEFITIGLGDTVIYVTKPDERCIYVFSFDGAVLCKHSHGEYRSYIRAAITDAQDNLLVCDNRNHCLKVMSHEGNWQSLQSDEKILYPRDAVVVEDKVFVVGGNLQPYLGVYHIPK